MSKSLDQAFIRAYSKENARRPVPPPAPVGKQLDGQHLAQPNEQLSGQLNEQLSGQASQVGQIDLVVRFDTATCEIPAPHTPPTNNRSSDNPRDVVAVVPGPSRRTERPPLRAAASAAALPRPQHEAALRSAIAEQMTRAGEWDGSIATSFQGGFPMLSQHHQRPAPVSIVPIRAEHAAPGRDAPNPQASKREAVAQETRPEFSGHSPEPPPREIHAPSLQSPALLSHQTKPGDFFRLDRPSYSAAPVVRIDDEFSDSGDSSSAMLESSGSQVSMEPSPRAKSAASVSQSENTVRQDAAHAAKIERVQAAERELRGSKLRIFNPVWEVDSFQWPDICLELLEQRSEVLETVAKNLNEAVQEGLQVLAITSPQGGEGRTTVACCLAKLVGSRGLNVAIVDGDIDNPTLSYQTNLDIQQDWKSAILNQLPLEEVAVHSIDDQVTLVPLIGAIDASELSVDDNRIEFMLHELSESFDLVIVDMGHMNSPRSLVGSLCARGVISAVVAVVDHRTADAQEIGHCLRRIRQAGVASIGVVENFAA